jgi:ABC-type sugar transport system, periplasmic component
MKKWIVVALVCVVVLSLVACSSAPAASSAAASSAAPAESSAAPAASSAAPAASSAAPASSEAAASPAAASGTLKVVQPAAGKKAPTVAFVPKVIGQAWWDYVHEGGVNAWAKAASIDVKYQGPTTVDAAAQVKIMTDLVSQMNSGDILCFSPNDPNACENIAKQARAKGIIVVATEASGMKNIDYDVEAGSEQGMGQFLMDQLATAMGGSGKYITMVGSLTMESQNNWADAGVKEQQAKYPNMTLVPDKRVVDNSDAEQAYEKTKELIQKYPDLKGILGTGSFDAPGAARAIQELGLTGKVFATSVALPSETKDYLKSGVLQSVGLWDPAKSAQAMLNLAMAKSNGTEIKTGMDLGVDGYNSVNVNGTLVQGNAWIAITKDNVGNFSF